LDYIVYRTKNLVNGRYYIGYHQTKDASVFDGYLGSGYRMKRAIVKYGEENFERETLAIFESSAEASDFEELVVAHCLGDENCYNIAFGGRGGKTVPTSTRSEIAKRIWQDQESRQRMLETRRKPKSEQTLTLKRLNSWERSKKTWLKVDEIQKVWLENGKPGYHVLNKVLMRLGYPHQNLQKVVGTFSTVDYSADKTFQNWKHSRTH